MLGSPLDPFADEAAHVAAALRIAAAYPTGSAALTCGDAVPRPALRADAPVPDRPAGADGRRRAATIVIPVHDGGAVVLACLDSVLASRPKTARSWSWMTDRPTRAMVAALDDLARQRKIALLRHPPAPGFPAAANAGILAATGRDVVLLNSDTLVPPGWLERLRSRGLRRPRYRHRHPAVERRQHPELPRTGRHQSEAGPGGDQSTGSPGGTRERRPPSSIFRWASASVFTSGATA